MPASSAAAAIAPPSASTSLTRCPLPIPPIDGLQLIWPSVSIECVSNSVDAPIRAAASAASVPAWPPPTTMTSNDREGCMGLRSVQPRLYFWRRSAVVAVPSACFASNQLGVVDAVLEVRRADRDEAERSVERLEPRLRGNAHARARPQRRDVRERPRHQLAADPTAAHRDAREDPADRRLAVLGAGRQQARVGNGFGVACRPGSEMMCDLVPLIGVEKRTLLLDREHPLARAVDGLQL